MNYRIIEHTADIGIEVEADSLSELFENTALAMLSIVAPRGAERKTPRGISLDADDVEALMYSWLNEIVFIIFSDRFLPASFEVKITGERHLEAELWGEPINTGKNQLEMEIKGATFNDMYVIEKNGSWSARVIFDV